uniref:Neutrophil cytosolic factor 1 n=1 Tax=Nothobranchius furzeri TaxID=105023 RepID=A0A8C6L9Y0_NOTFU
MEEIYVRHVELLGFEKRFFPSQHYVYMLMVKWSDLGEKLIYRTYPEIHTFHKSLKEMFPIEAGEIDRKDRTIPSLPAPRWVDSQKSREDRKTTLAEYCQSLVNLPAHISRCKHLSNFFKVRPEDENPPAPNTLKRNETPVESRELTRGIASEISGPIILDTYRVVADFEKTTKYEIALHIGDFVEIVEKNENVPCVPAGELYVTNQAYKAEEEDEISLSFGETVEVIHKLLDGWWVVRKRDETGHFPSMYLQKADGQNESLRTNPRAQKPPPRRSTIRNAKSIHNKSRKRLSQEAYRKNSRRYLQERGNRFPDKNSKTSAKSPLQEMKNQNNIPEQSTSSSESELKKEAPVIPPRPSPELILERCTDNTRKKMSIHKSRSGSSS